MRLDRQPIVIGLAIAVSLVATAHAEPESGPAKRRAAQRHFEQAQAHFAAKSYDAAAAEYQAAYDILPVPGLLFNIGLCRENLGDAAGAIELYRRYLTETPDGQRTAEARARMHALETQLADAASAAKARAQIDAATRLAERERYADALAELDAARSLSTDPSIALAIDRERRRIEALRDAEAEPAPGTIAGVADAARPAPSLIPGLALLGGALAASGVGLVYQLRANRLGDELDGELDHGTPPLDSRDPRFDEGRSAAFRASLAWGFAGVAGVAGALLTARAVLARRRPRHEPAVRAVVTPERAGLELELSW